MDPPHWNQVNFDHPHKNKSISMLTVTPSDLRPASKTMSISTTYTKSSQSITTLKTTQFRPTHSQFRHTTTKSIPIPTPKSSQFQPRTQQPNQCHPHTEIKSSSIPHIETKSIATTHTKTKSISMLALQTSDFRPAHSKQVNSDPYTEIMPISMPHTQIKSISTTHTKT